MQTTSRGSAAATTVVGADGSLPEHLNGANEEALSFESNVILRRPKTDQKQMECGENHLLEFGKELSPERLGRMTPESLDSRSEDFFDDDGQSSVCSDMVFCGGGGGGASLPAKYSTLDRNFKMRKTAGSLVEALEKQRRESVGNRLKELHRTTTNRRTSLFSAINEMPVIAKRSPSGENLLLPLPRQAPRRSSYQSVIAGRSFLSRTASQSHLFGSGALDRLERRNSITGGPRVQTPTTRPPYFPLRETESLSGWEHFVEPSSSERLSSVRGRCVPSHLDGDRSPSNGISAAQPIEATTTHCNDDNNDDTVKSDDSEWKRFRFGEDPAESNGETERRCKEYEEKNDEAEGIPAVPSIPNDGIASTDIRINGSSSSSSPSSSLGTNYGIRACIGTSGSVQSHADDEAKVKQPTCSSKAEENRVDVGVCVADEGMRRFSAAAPKTDEAARKTPNDDDCIVVKGDSYSPKGKTKYYSDIRIQLKEAAHSPPSRNYGASENSPMQNGNSPSAASNEREATDDDDDDDDDDDGESDSSEMAENIAPNWSSYPGPLLNASPADNSNFEDEAIDIPIKRNISTLEINVNYVNSDDRGDRTDDRPNAFRSAEKTVSHPSTNTDDQVSGKNRIRDSDLSYCSQVYLRRDVRERSTGPEDPPQTFVGFYGNRPSASQIDDCRQGLDGGNCATERREVFLVESCSVSARAQTLPRHQMSSRNPNDTRAGSCNGGCPQGNSSPVSQNGGWRENGTACGRESMLSPTGAARTFCSKQEGSGPLADQRKTWPATAVNGGMSEFSSVMHLKSSDGHRTDKGSGRRSSSSSSDTPPLPPSSVERIWESVEEPRPRTLRRKIRFEPDSGSLPPTSANSQRRSRASSSGCEPAKGVADDRTTKTMTMMTMLTRSLSSEDNGGLRRGDSSSSVPEGSGEQLLLDIDVPKGGLGLGFCIEGGKDGPYGDRPITVKRLFRVSSDPKASGAPEATLRPGDEIISANGRDMTFLSRYVAWNYLKTLPEGTIKLVIRRRQQ